MAEHIQSIAASGIARVDAAAFTARAQTGMLLFASHSKRDAVSAAIEDVTASPFSHVGMVYQCSYTGKHLLLESVWPGGARIGGFDCYVSGYDGDLVLCEAGSSFSRPLLLAALQRALGMLQTELDRPYDVEDEIKLVLHQAMPFVHPELGAVDHSCFCSAYMAAGLGAAGFLIQPPKCGGDVTPEELWRHDFIVPVVALVKGIGGGDSPSRAAGGSK